MKKTDIETTDTKVQEKDLTKYLSFNKKHTKVKMSGKPKFLGITGIAIQTVLPFSFIAYRYDLFTFRNAGYAITGWGVVILGSTLLIFRKNIVNTLKEAESALGDTYRRSKLGNTMIILAGIVLLTNFFVEAFVVLFLVVAGSTYASLPFYNSYDKVLRLKEEMQEELENRNVKKKMDNMNI